MTLKQANVPLLYGQWESGQRLGLWVNKDFRTGSIFERESIDGCVCKVVNSYESELL
jgi:hypothetical protein